MNTPPWLTKVLLDSLLLATLALGFINTTANDDALLAEACPTGSLTKGGGN